MSEDMCKTLVATQTENPVSNKYVQEALLITIEHSTAKAFSTQVKKIYQAQPW